MPDQFVQAVTTIPDGNGRRYVSASIRAAQRGVTERSLARERERGGPEVEPYWRWNNRIFYIDGGDQEWLDRRKFRSREEEHAQT